MSPDSVEIPVADAPPPGPPGRLVAGRFRESRCRDTWRAAGTRDWLLIMTTRGTGRIGHQGGAQRVKRGDVVLLQPGTRHDYGSERLGCRWEFWWAHFLPAADWEPWLEWPEAARGVRALRISDAGEWRVLTRIWHRVLTHGQGRGNHGDALAANALAEILIRCDAAQVRQRQALRDPRLIRVREHMATHLGADLSLPHLARVSGLSPTHFSHWFKREAGCPPRLWLERLRLNHACRLLTLTQAKVESVARQVGYANAFYFSLRFKRHTGMNPSAYRRSGAGFAEDRPAPDAAGAGAKKKPRSRLADRG